MMLQIQNWMRTAAVLIIGVMALNGRATDAERIALIPQQNECRNLLSLDGVWRFCADRENVGEAQGWQQGLPQSVSIAVPGSWNEQIEGLRNYLGLVWYERETIIPSAWKNERVMLRVGSAVYAAKVWVNGQLVGSHEGGHLPFAFEINNQVKWGQKNRITITVENELREDRVPTGNIKGAPLKNYPAANYDFFPYSGLHRSVVICTVPRSSSIQDITVETNFEGNTGLVDVRLKKQGKADGYRLTLTDANGKSVAQQQGKASGETTVKLKVPQVQLWSPENPYLYELQVELRQGGKTVDAYHCNVGVRTIAVSGSNLLLNGKPVTLKGFGKHEDFPIFGRGTALPVIVRDFELMKWVGANSFRTSHYPYDESVYDIADREGFLIIDEIPAVGLIFYDSEDNINRRKSQCEQYIDEMIARDKNHPSVILWCVANEPSPKSLGGGNYTGFAKDENDRENETATQFLSDLMRQCRQLDKTRPATFVGVMGGPASWMKECDVICINRYFGWYTNIGDFPTAMKYFGGEMDKLHGQYQRPFIVTEFGADAIDGMHSTDGEMYSEEFQRQFTAAYLDVASQRDYVAGMMLWNFADFRTGQALMRVGGMNLKGVFTQDRKPKMAAHLLRERWVTNKDKKY